MFRVSGISWDIVSLSLIKCTPGAFAAWPALAFNWLLWHAIDVGFKLLGIRKQPGIRQVRTDVDSLERLYSDWAEAIFQILV